MQLFKNLKPKERLAFIIISVLVLIGIIFFTATFINRIGKVEVTIKYAPYAATVTLNNIKVNNNSKIWIEPGKYNLKVEFNHFSTTERVVEITTDYRYIVGTLSTVDDEGEAYINSHKQEFTEAEGLVGLALNEEGIAIKKKYPILNYLPINNRLYSISYAYTDDNEPIINVKAQPEYLDVAVRKIKSLKNVDLTVYQINFTAKNPFAIYNEKSKPTPEETIKASFNLSNYKLSAGQNIANNYYAATIYKYDYDRDLIYSHYRVLLKKEDNKWHIVSAPQPLLTQQNTPETSTDIINSVNSLEP